MVSLTISTDWLVWHLKSPHKVRSPSEVCGLEPPISIVLSCSITLINLKSQPSQQCVTPPSVHRPRQCPRPDYQRRQVRPGRRGLPTVYLRTAMIPLVIWGGNKHEMYSCFIVFFLYTEWNKTGSDLFSCFYAIWWMSVNNRGVAKTCCRSNRKTLFLTPFSENWIKLDLMDLTYFQWDFQDPKMEVLYHVRPYFGGISSYIALT